jgi:hypothetical protein
MDYKKGRIADGAMSLRVSGRRDRVHPKRTWRSKQACRGRELAWPPDALTRLLMQADGVTEIEIDDLLRRVAAARADR